MKENPLVVIASNRGPFAFSANEDGTFTSERGAGGLVTALSAIAQRYDVLWVAAALSDGDRLWAEAHHDQPQTVDETRIQLLRIEPAVYDQYYNVIANPLLWFIHHQLWDIPRQPNFTRDMWAAWHDGYVYVNRLFAEAVARSVTDELRNGQRPVLIFPQDYQLHLMPLYLREKLGQAVQIQPFLHIPWPGPDAWRILPQEVRATLFSAMLSSDRIGFQTQKDAFNFVQTMRFYLPDAHSYGSRDSVVYHERKIEAKSYPISIDVEKVEEIVEARETQLLKAQLFNYIGDSRLVLRVDRIEPSKNILRSLQSYAELLELYQEWHGKVRMLNLLVPSRMEVQEYQDYLGAVMAEAGMINARYSDGFWEPVRIIVGGNYARALAAMQVYDVLVVNPLADGMNLVAKEGVLVNQRDGVLLLSEYAGAYYELGDNAMIVSPFDIHGTAHALHRALSMPQEERRQRAEALREQVKQADVNAWFRNQVDHALAAVTSQPNSASTPETPAVSTSAESRTSGGVSAADTPASTPTPTA